MFKLELQRRDGIIVRVVVRGGGNGHGVGMCQMGALEMARRGFKHASILAHYYPGAVLDTLY
jgi:stage II sporulation protein D